MGTTADAPSLERSWSFPAPPPKAAAACLTAGAVLLAASLAILIPATVAVFADHRDFPKNFPGPRMIAWSLIALASGIWCLAAGAAGLLAPEVRLELHPGRLVRHRRRWKSSRTVEIPLGDIRWLQVFPLAGLRQCLGLPPPAGGFPGRLVAVLGDARRIPLVSRWPRQQLLAAAEELRARIAGDGIEASGAPARKDPAPEAPTPRAAGASAVRTFRLEPLPGTAPAGEASWIAAGLAAAAGGAVAFLTGRADLLALLLWMLAAGMAGNALWIGRLRRRAAEVVVGPGSVEVREETAGSGILSWTLDEIGSVEVDRSRSMSPFSPHGLAVSGPRLARMIVLEGRDLEELDALVEEIEEMRRRRRSAAGRERRR